MRSFFIFVVLVFMNACNAQNNKKLQLEITSFFKISDKDIERCQRENKDFRKLEADESTIKSISDGCLARYEHLNLYKKNTLKILGKAPKVGDYIIINYIYDNVMLPHSTKTILNFGTTYLGLKHYYDYKNDVFVEKNEEFEVSNSDMENIRKIDEYLKVGKSEYVGNKSSGLIGNNAHWHVIKKSNGKIKVIELFRIR
jgi:hypothetical protein